MEPILRVANLSKSFGTLQAIRDVSFEVYPNEVIGLTGLSGSGKSVIAMLIGGLHPPSSGQVFLNEKRLQWPFRPQSVGIEVIHQEPLLVDRLDITSNIFLGNEIRTPLIRKWISLPVPNESRMDQEATRILEEIGVHFRTLREKVMNLSSEQRQLVAIARAITRKAQLIFVDEPTTQLSYSYQQKLLSIIQEWQRQKSAVIFSSTNLDHLFAVTDRIVVLRKGQVVATYRTDETNREEIVAALVGINDQQQHTPAIWALENYYSAREKADKLYHQQKLLERDLVQQDNLNQQLLAQLSKQVKALNQANTALQAAQRRLLTEREQERKHLARELHDQIIQDLLSTNYWLEEIAAHETATEALGAELAEIRQSIRQLVEDVRRICGNLRPPTIDSLGLGAALQSHTQEWSRRTGIPVRLTLDSQPGRLPETIELSIFRIVQEGLSNIYRHARATAVEINLKHTSPRTLLISIADNGQGLREHFDLSLLSGEGHYGLLGISERVALLGGHLRIQNQVSGGLLLQVEVPHPRVDVTPSRDSAEVGSLTDA